MTFYHRLSCATTASNGDSQTFYQCTNGRPCFRQLGLVPFDQMLPRMPIQGQMFELTHIVLGLNA